MARAPNENVNKAYELFKKGYKLIDISKELDIPSSTVRRWKKTYNWDNERSDKNSERSFKQNNKKIKKKEPIVEEVNEVLENAELTDKQRLFCIYYIKYFNATKAYQKAYECDYITANSHGYKLLLNVVIKEEIEKLKQHKLNRVMLSEEDIFQRYMDIAFSDITDYVNFGKREIEILEDNQSKTIEVNYVDFNDSYNVDGTIISEVKQGKDGVSIKLHDKMKALQWLSDHMNIATDKQKAELEVLKSKIVKNEKSKEDKIDEYFAKLEEGIRNA